MQRIGFINLFTFLFDLKILSKGGQKFGRRQAIEIFHHPVVVDNSQLVGGETYGHEIVVFFVSAMIRILLCLFGPYQGSGSRTMMPVGNIKRRHGSKLLGDDSNVFAVVDHPESVSESVTGSNKIVYRLLSRILADNGIEHRIVGISKEHRFDVGIVHTDMLHAVFFLVTPGEFVLFDGAVHIIGHVSTHHQPILCLAIHGLGIDIIILFVILHQPSFVTEQTEILCRFRIHLLIMFVCPNGKVYFRFNNVVQ